MPRLLKTLTVFLIASMLPLLALHAQQTAPETKKEDPPAKDAAKPAEAKKDAKPSTDPIDRIKEEGLKHSKVMETLSYLTDVIGPRLTGSPGMKRANIWTRDKLNGWGLENAHLEAWGKFGRGWTLKRFSAQVVEPQCIPLIAYPKAWSPGTGGPLVATGRLLDAKNEADLAKYKGKLKGAIVLTAPARIFAARFEPLATRLSDHDLLELADASEPTRRGFGRPPTTRRAQPRRWPRRANSRGSNGSAPAASTGHRRGRAGRAGPRAPAG